MRVGDVGEDVVGRDVAPLLEQRMTQRKADTFAEVCTPSVGRGGEDHRRKRRDGELRRVESDEQVWNDLLAQRADFLGHQTDVDRFAVHKLERPGADPELCGRVASRRRSTKRSSPTWVNGHTTSAKTSIMVASRS